MFPSSSALPQIDANEFTMLSSLEYLTGVMSGRTRIDLGVFAAKNLAGLKTAVAER